MASRRDAPASSARRRSLPGLTALVALAAGIMLGACGSSAGTVQIERPSGGSTAESEWVVVKYRDSPVDVRSPGFVELDRSDSSLIKAAWYDTSNDYLVINLNGTNYHYCAFPGSAWSELISADSMGSHFRDRIKGNYDCRHVGVVPGY